MMEMFIDIVVLMAEFFLSVFIIGAVLICIGIAVAKIMDKLTK